MQLNLEEYLTDEEIKEIVIQKFKDSISFDSEEDIKRIIINCAYELVWKKVDEVFGNHIEDILSAKIQDIIKDLSEFNIFKKPDAWDRETNNAYDFLQECINKEKKNIESIVKENIPVEVLQILKENMDELIKDSVQDLYKNI